MPRVPTTMRAAVIDRFGPPSVLKVREVPIPELGANEVLIALHTAGVGSWDAQIRGGWWPKGKPRFPLILGTDGAGTVAAVGPRVRRFKVRDKVYAYVWLSPKGGFYAEYVVVAAEKVSVIPKGLDLKKAGAIPVTGLTALQGIDDTLHVKKGENVIVHGAAGGVGSMALQFAKLRGARVLATVTDRKGITLVKRLGADAAVDGKRENITDAARRFAPDGVDVVFGTAGGEPLEQCLEALKRGGRAAYPNGVEPEPKKRSGIKILTYDAASGVRQFAALNRAVEAAKLKVVIDSEFSLEKAADSHRRLDKGRIHGKVVLRIR